MKYHTIITSLLLAVAQATLNQNLREVATPLENERVSQEVSVSCVKDGRLTLYNCNKCCSNSCKRFSWLLPPIESKSARLLQLLLPPLLPPPILLPLFLSVLLPLLWSLLMHFLGDVPHPVHLMLPLPSSRQILEKISLKNLL